MRHSLDLADSIAAQGRPDEALGLLRGRVRAGDASPYLLRAFSLRLGGVYDHPHAKPDAQRRAEARDALRVAIQDEHDPARDMSLYNLQAMLTGPDATRATFDEAAAIVDQILESDSGYRKLWWIKWAKALHRRRDAERVCEEGNCALAHQRVTEAARWTLKALHARPRLEILYVSPRRGFLRLVRYPRSAILHAAAFEAHAGAKHRIRAARHKWTMEKLRRRYIRRGGREFDKANWGGAVGYFGWASVGLDGAREQTALVHLAVAACQVGDEARADGFWTEALTRRPEEASAIRESLLGASENGTDVRLPRGVPGG